jgi:hypothetical protein
VNPFFVVQNNVGIITIGFAEATLGIGCAVGNGVLASIDINATGLGTSS